jgi:acetolactate decarboxylase
MKNLTLLCTILALIGCKIRPTTPATENIRHPELRITSAMRNVMHDGELQGKISLDTITEKTNLYGLGPLEYLQGEVTILDGHPYVSRVGAGSTMQVEETWNIKAPFFVRTNVAKWKEMSIPRHVQTIPELEELLARITKDLGSSPFPFKLTATVESATIHIVNLPQGTVVHSHEEAHQGQQNYTLTHVPAEMIGFYSTGHAGVFTHHDRTTHIHLITADRTAMGHLDEMLLETGTAKLYLPE